MFFQISLIFGSRTITRKAVRVIAIGQKQHFHVHTLGQQHINTSLGCLDTGRVTVVEHRDVLRKAMNHLNLLLRQCRTRRGNHMLHAHLMHRNHIRISLNQKTKVVLHDGLLGLKKTVKFLFLGIDGRLGRVLILHVHALGGLIEYTTAKAHYFTAHRVNREDDAPPETILQSAVFLFDTQTGLDQIFLPESLAQSFTRQRVFLHRTEAQLKAFDDVVPETA